MKNTLRILIALGLSQALFGCGPQQDSSTPPVPPAPIPGAAGTPTTQACNVQLIQCPGGGFPNVSAAPECKQTCDGAQ